MPLAFVCGRIEANSLGKPEDLQKEWQACRDAIGRLDGTLVDLRKYGFGLASTLLTANGILGGIANLLPKDGNGFTVPTSVIAALVAVTMVLVAVLFVVDRYYAVLQWGAVNRARSLEYALSLDMTNEIAGWVAYEARVGPRPIRVLWRWVALLQYGSFVLVALILGIATMRGDGWPSHQQGLFMWIVGGISLLVIGAVYWLGAAEWSDKTKQPPARVHSMTVPFAATTVPAKSKKAESDIGHLPKGARLVAIILPTNDPDLSIVGCRVDGLTLRAALGNPTDHAITIAAGDLVVWLYT